MVERSLSMREVRGSIPRISIFFLSPHIFRHSPATVPSMQTDGGSADASMAPQAVFSVLLSVFAVVRCEETESRRLHRSRKQPRFVSADRQGKSGAMRPHASSLSCAAAAGTTATR
jgi:hypothetical protein